MATSSRAVGGGAYRACVFLLATIAVDGPPPLAAETGDVQARAEDGEYGAHALEQRDTISWTIGEYRTTSSPKPARGGPLGFRFPGRIVALCGCGARNLYPSRVALRTGRRATLIHSWPERSRLAVARRGNSLTNQSSLAARPPCAAAGREPASHASITRVRPRAH
jgi:hypothetical protein